MPVLQSLTLWQSQGSSPASPSCLTLHMVMGLYWTAMAQRDCKQPCSLGARCNRTVKSSAETPGGLHKPEVFQAIRPFAADKRECCKQCKQPEFHCSLISLEASLWTCSSHMLQAVYVLLPLPVKPHSCCPWDHQWNTCIASAGTLGWHSGVQLSENIRVAQCVTAIRSHRTHATRQPDQSKCLMPLWSITATKNKLLFSNSALQPVGHLSHGRELSTCDSISHPHLQLPACQVPLLFSSHLFYFSEVALSRCVQMIQLKKSPQGNASLV